MTGVCEEYPFLVAENRNFRGKLLLSSAAAAALGSKQRDERVLKAPG